MSDTKDTIENKKDEIGLVFNDNLVSFIWLEITRKCNLNCIHCYAESDPTLGHGCLTTDQWKEIMDEARQMGVKNLQFIGGEPTLHPDFVDLLYYAAQLGFSLEVYTNLIHVNSYLWDIFQDLNIAIATSFYSLYENFHNKVTQNSQSQKKTLENIQQALARNLHLRVGVIEVFSEQETSATENMLRDLGVSHVGRDRIRGIGRGQLGTNIASSGVEQLCGACTSGKVAIDPDGNVYPCVFSRWLCVGNIRNQSLTEIVRSSQMASTLSQLNQHFVFRRHQYQPDNSNTLQLRTQSPHACRPEPCRPDIDPCTPNLNCPPVGCIPGDCTPNCNPIQCLPDRNKCFPERSND